ncbi:hypothetical protein [Luteibacter aegosomatissinici]|uniref:hypothetical protein n=1 Tax=Luteibacter aegosomatissinici TaxID=2911539 RepID=UPI001FF8BA8F|nr:hypothetical protein [Luteibacter aegosomatissinici]UPG96134.1 hypothetical protein L2Y97_08505 [Luteibacter aegosomatissinici]
MNLGRAAVACFLFLAQPHVAAAMGQAAAKATPPGQAEATRAQVDAARGQAKAEDQKNKDLKKRVDALETNSQASRKALEERDQKIAELERQLEAARHP